MMLNQPIYTLLFIGIMWSLSTMGFASSGVSLCQLSSKSLKAEVQNSLDKADEYFRYGKYLKSQFELHPIFMKVKGCPPMSSPVIRSIRITDVQRENAVSLYLLTLWEMGDHEMLERISAEFLKQNSMNLWGCRIHLYRREYGKSAECFYKEREYSRARRDYRANEILKHSLEAADNGG